MEVVKTSTVDTLIDGQRLTGFLAQPARPGPRVILLHAWWGLNDFFKGQCVKLAEAGFTTFAPDLNAGQIAATIEEAEALMQARDGEATQAVALAAVRWMRDQPGSSVGLGLVGFSMGASWALELSRLAADDVRAVVLFYDAYDADLTGIRAAFQGHYAGLDTWTEVEWANQLEAALRNAGLSVEFHHYPEAGHWFIEADRPDAYRPDDAALAWQRTLDFFKRELSGSAS